MKEAYLYKKIIDKKVRCDLCNHRCVIDNSEKGKCCVRQNIDGTLYSLVYRKLIAENSDPIEKKPLFHFLPGTYSLSVATMGCNFRCFFCQNFNISQLPHDLNMIEGTDVSPEMLVSHALAGGDKSISYTYTEPTVFFEYAYDTAKLASQKGLKNVFVTNGFMTRECLMMIEPYLDAANIDLKSFSEDTYKEKIGGRLKPVLNNIILMKKLGIWVEVTTLIIPGINDSRGELQKIAEFLAGIDKGIPWHISAYYPQYKSKIPPTGVEKIEAAIDIGKKAGLKYVYGGNTPGSFYENTLCPACNTILIRRTGFLITDNKIKNGLCPECGEKIEGVF
ncbi:MAG: AmmeMemoRadiSam system radical SAM enzyme [Actinomycetota bacterium]|jgi:pyruvate formate lyase activating enzyme|nr:AmmeMemoRadiSam system radical SAM enzyme [Actinomycetota bacterium]MDD5601091.1 AmmeMemoRadiSam system radical SAM enzyme [Actinomycetota bacterium]